MKRLVIIYLISQLDYNTSKEIEVCEAFIGGKQCKRDFKPSEIVTLMPLELVHSEVCAWDSI